MPCLIMQRRDRRSWCWEMFWNSENSPKSCICGIGEFIVEEAQKGKTLDLVVTVGEGASFIAKQVEETSNIAVKICKDNEEAAAFVKECAKEGDWILVKGSRGMHMDEVVQKVVM